SFSPVGSPGRTRPSPQIIASAFSRGANSYWGASKSSSSAALFSLAAFASSASIAAFAAASSKASPSHQARSFARVSASFLLSNKALRAAIARQAYANRVNDLLERQAEAGASRTAKAPRDRV